LIDPEGQAGQFIRNVEKYNNLCVLKQSDPKLIPTLINCVTFGIPVLLEDVTDELGTMIELQGLLKKGARQTINNLKIGGKYIEMNQGFKLFLTTKETKPELLRTICNKTSVINCQKTEESLRDQLTEVVMETEMPQFLSLKNSFTEQNAEHFVNLRDAEQALAVLLNGGLLAEKGTELKQLLSACSILSREIYEKQDLLVNVEKAIAPILARESEDNSISSYASKLYFTLRALSNVNHMYQFSLGWFVRLFVRSLEETEKFKDVEKRREAVKEHLTYSLYRNVTRSLYEEDKLLFSLLLCSVTSGNTFTAAEKEFFSSGWNKYFTAVGDKPAVPNPVTWLPEEAWAKIAAISDLHPDYNINKETFLKHQDTFKRMYNSQEPQDVNLPDELINDNWTKRWIPKLLLIKALRPDKLTDAIRVVVKENLGERYLDSVCFDGEAILEDSSCTTPIIVMLNTGDDQSCTDEIRSLAERKGPGSSRVLVLPLGQGKGPLMTAVLLKGVTEGNWVVLKDCHQAPSLLPQLEKLWTEAEAGDIHPGFRLWLTSSPTDSFPVRLLQKGVKVVVNPPTGISAHMLQCYKAYPVCEPKFFNNVKNQAAWKKLLFSLAFYYAQLKERVSYSPLGFNIRYDWSITDFIISALQLADQLNNNQSIDYNALKYLFAECNLGGRVTDDKDRRLINALLDRIFCPQMMETENFSLDSNGVYKVPSEGDYESYVTYIKNLSSRTNANAVGLNGNADITRDLKMSLQLMDKLGLAWFSEMDDRKKLLIPLIAETLEKLPQNFELEKTTKISEPPHQQNVKAMFHQEMLRYNKMLDSIRTRLTNLNNALKGKAGMTKEQEEICRCLSNNETPQNLARRIFTSVKPFNRLMAELTERVNSIKARYESDVLPAVIWLPGLFFPQALLSAVQQDYSAKHQIPLHHVTLTYHVIDDDKSPDVAEDGVYISGLYLEGARWDKTSKTLEDPTPTVLHNKMPVIWIKPMKSSEVPAASESYATPLYRVSSRKGVLSTTGHSTNFITMVNLPTKQPASHWVRRGVAMLTQLDY